MRLADRLKVFTSLEEEAASNSAPLFEQTTLFLMGLEDWHRIEDWDYCPTDNSLTIFLLKGEEPELSEKSTKALAKAGFSKVYFGGWSPLTAISLTKDPRDEEVAFGD
jgi:hypothetical protein